MYGLNVSSVNLAQVLAPVATTLDQCWWYLGGAGMTFPWIPPARRLATEKPHRPRRGPGRHSGQGLPIGPFDPQDWERYRTQCGAAAAEYEKWVDVECGYRIGVPGFFSRYAAGMDGDWQMYFASDAPVLQRTSLEEAVRRFDRVWFDAPPDDLPRDICLITRDIDSGYLDLFFRDDWMCQTTRGYLEGHGIPAPPYRPLDVRPDRQPGKHADKKRSRT